MMLKVMPDEEVRQAGPQRLSSALGHTTAVASSSAAAVVEGEEQQRGEEDDEAPILEILAAVREGRFQDTKDIWIRLLRLCRWESPFLRLSGNMRKETERAAAMPTAEGLRRMREAIDEERARWARLAEGAGDDQMGGVLDLGEEAVSDEEGGGGGGAAPRGGDDKKMRKKHQKQKKTRTTEEEAGEVASGMCLEYHVAFHVCWSGRRGHMESGDRIALGQVLSRLCFFLFDVDRGDRMGATICPSVSCSHSNGAGRGGRGGEAG